MDYDDCVAMARLCAKNARTAQTKEVARQLWKMAREHQAKAAELNNGELPHIGSPPQGIE
jgi:hypothetical protein